MLKFNPITDAIDAWFKALGQEASNFLQLAAQQQLKIGLDRFVKSPFPSLNTSGIIEWWNILYGLMIVILLIVFLVELAFVIVSAKSEGLYETIKSIGRAFLQGTFGLVPIALALLAAEFVMGLIVSMNEPLVGTDQWSSQYAQTHNYGAGEIAAQAALVLIMGFSTMILVVQGSTQLPALLFSIYAWLFSGMFGNGTVGRLARSVSLGSVYATVFSRVVQVAMIGAGAIILAGGRAQFDAVTVAALAAAVTFSAMFVPMFFTLVLAFVLFMREKHRNPEFIAKIMSSQVVRSITTAQLNDQRVGTALPSGVGENRVSRQELQAAASTATVAGIGKLTSSVLAMLPTPQTKVASLGVMAVTAAIEGASAKAQSRVQSAVNRIDADPNRR